MRRELVSDRGDTLRPWADSDASAVLAAFSDPSMAMQVDRAIDSLDDALGWIAERRASRERGDAHSWAVVDGSGLLGSVTISSIDHRHDSGWMSYWTCNRARGGGVASSALRAVSAWAFADLGLFRLELGHRTNNPASCRVALAASYSIEGIERQKLRYGDDRFDVELHARLATDH